MSTKHSKLIIPGILGFIVGILIATSIVNNKIEPTQNIEIPLVETPIETPKPITITKTGLVSYYSFAGCLGCNESRITASGDILDDSKFTLAIPAEWRSDIPMGTPVRVTNLDNGRAVDAIVNDTGGFLKYDRIADLSVAVCQSINCETDVSNIQIELVRDGMH